MASSFFGGLSGGAASGLKERKEGGSLTDRFKKTFGKNVAKVPNDAGANDIGSDTGLAHSGGRIPKTGVYRMKENEVVIPADLVKKIESRVGKRSSKRKASRKSSRR